MLLLAENIPDSSLLAHFAGDVPGAATYPWRTAALRMRPELSDWVLAENFSHYRFPVRIERVEPVPWCWRNHSRSTCGPRGGRGTSRSARW